MTTRWCVQAVAVLALTFASVGTSAAQCQPGCGCGCGSSNTSRFSTGMIYHAPAPYANSNYPNQPPRSAYRAWPNPAHFGAAPQPVPQRHDYRYQAPSYPMPYYPQ